MSSPAVAATPVKKVARKPKDGAKKTKAPTHPPTMQMVVQAMMNEKSSKGVSVRAISKHITEHHKIPASRLRLMLRRSLAAALKEGKLTRPHGQATTAVLSGRYRLPAKSAKAAAAPAKKAPAKKPAAAKKAGAAKKKPATKKAPAKKTKTPKKAAAKPKAKSASKVKKAPKKPVAKKVKTPKKAAKPAKKV